MLWVRGAGLNFRVGPELAFRFTAKTLGRREGRYERQSLARPRGTQLDSDPMACANAGLQHGRADQLQSASFVRIAWKIRPFRRMDGNFDNRLHALANVWTVAMRCESRPHLDLFSRKYPSKHRH